jgi:hypothetical protein
LKDAVAQLPLGAKVNTPRAVLDCRTSKFSHLLQLQQLTYDG